MATIDTQGGKLGFTMTVLGKVRQAGFRGKLSARSLVVRCRLHKILDTSHYGPRICLAVISLIILLISAACISDYSASTPTPRPPTWRPIPTYYPTRSGDPSLISFNQIVEVYERASSSVFEDYFAQIDSKRVHWMGYVTDIKGGLIHLDLGQHDSHTVILSDISPTSVAALTPGQLIEFEAVIQGYSAKDQFALVLASGQILSELGMRPPTLTPTGTPTITPTPTATQVPAPVAYLSVVNQTINLRSGPGLDHDIVTNAHQGDQLPVYARTEDGSWFLLDWQQQLWVSSSVVQYSQDISAIPILPTATPTITPTPTRPPDAEVVVATDSLNLRDGPGTAYRIIGSLKQGDELVIIAANADRSWLQVRASRQEGWVYAPLCTVYRSFSTVRTVSVAAPTAVPVYIPSGPTALCCDGTYSYSTHRQGTCSWHGGVCQWYW